MLEILEMAATGFTAVLIFGTVYLGIHGLGREYRTKKQQKLNASGKQAMRWMIGLGVLTFASTMLGGLISSYKEGQEAKEREERFQRQMAALDRQTITLKGVTGSLSQLQLGMGDSLQTQRGIFDRADLNLRMSGMLQDQARQNTSNVLRRVFEEGNRVAAERIAVSVEYNCPGEGIPFERGLEVTSATLSVKGATGETLILSTSQNVPVNAAVVFHGFQGDLGRFETFRAWRGARVSIRLTGRAARIGIALEDFNRMTPEERAAQYDTNREPPSCPTTVALLLNGRRVLSAFSYFVRPRSAPDVADFENVPIENSRLPDLSD